MSFSKISCGLKAVLLVSGLRTDHPNVVSLHETFEDKSHIYLVAR